MSDKPSFFAELKPRNVYKVAAAYAVVAWLLIQIATLVFPFFEVPNRQGGGLTFETRRPTFSYEALDVISHH